MILPKSDNPAPFGPLNSHLNIKTEFNKRRRFRASDLPDNLDMVVIGQLFLGISLTGYQQLLRDVLAGKSGSLNGLLAALDSGQVATLGETAHSFKGEAGTLGLKKLADQAQVCELEGAQFTQARCQQMAIDVREAWDTAQALCQRMGLAQDRA